MRNELQAAIGRFEKRVKAGNQSLKKGKANGIPMGRAEIEFHKDMTLALTALRDAQARQEGCVSCKNRFWYFTDYRFNPNYCPNCGRDLDGATAEQSSGVEGGQL